MRNVTWFLLGFLVLSLPFLVVSSATSPSSTTMHVLYERYGSIYHVTSSPLIQTVEYTVSAVTYNATVINETGSTVITYNRTTYLLTFSNVVKNFTGEIDITVMSNMSLNVKTSIPNLIRVLVNSSGELSLVWAGINASEIDTFAYVNGTGYLLLQFANGSSITTVTVPIKVNETVSEKVSLTLEEVSQEKVKTIVTGKTVVQFNVPRRYTPIFFTTEFNGTYSNSTSHGYIATMAYFNGSLTPALVWKGEGIALGGFLRGQMDFNFETIEFYGVNGTVLGYVHESTANSTVMLTLGKISVSSFGYFSEVKIITINGVKPVKAEFIAHTYINGLPVVIAGNYSGNITSTANVILSHKVVVNSTLGVLAYLNVNSTVKVVVVIGTNSSYNVTLVKPEKVVITNITVNGKTYVSQEVYVNTTSQNIVFNVSVINNLTFVGVYKLVNGHLVELNSSNYFMLNGKIIVYDDPATEYYVVYSTPQQTTTSSSVTTVTTTTTTTPSTSMPITSSSSMISTSTTTVKSASNFTLPIIIAIIIIIVVVALVMVRRRS